METVKTKMKAGLFTDPRKYCSVYLEEVQGDARQIQA